MSARGTESERLLAQVLARGVDDWVSEDELIDVAADAGITAHQDRLTVALGIIAQGILCDLIEPGDISEDGFIPWSLSKTDSVERIVTEWIRRSVEDPYPGQIVWLRNTANGDRLGEIALMGEEPDSNG